MVVKTPGTTTWPLQRGYTSFLDRPRWTDLAMPPHAFPAGPAPDPEDNNLPEGENDVLAVLLDTYGPAPAVRPVVRSGYTDQEVSTANASTHFNVLYLRENIVEIIIIIKHQVHFMFNCHPKCNYEAWNRTTMTSHYGDFFFQMFGLILLSRLFHGNLSRMELSIQLNPALTPFFREHLPESPAAVGHLRVRTTE